MYIYIFNIHIKYVYILNNTFKIQFVPLIPKNALSFPELPFYFPERLFYFR